MAPISVDMLLRYASGILGIGEFAAGILAMVGAINLLSFFADVNIPAIRFGSDVNYNNEAYATLWLGLFHLYVCGPVCLQHK